MNNWFSMATRWNILDSIILTIEMYTEKILNSVKENREEPDVEIMIEAETKHLKEENNSLKELLYPKVIIKKESKYFCPNKKCQIEISGILVEKYNIKYCPECGQRIYRMSIRQETAL